MNPSTVSAVDYNSFLMQQSKRERELKMRRREAEQLLHGFRGFYGESFASWSPRHARKERNSFGLFGTPAEDCLRDPDDVSIRHSAHSRMGDYWGEAEGRDDSQRYGKRFEPNPLDPHCIDFLIDDRHYDGTRYPRTEQDMDVSDGVVMFSPREGSEFRERPPSTTRSSTSKRRSFFSPSNLDRALDGLTLNFDEKTPQGRTGNSMDDPEEDTEIRQQPPSTTRSSTSRRRSFFEDPATFNRDKEGQKLTYDGKTWQGQTGNGTEDVRTDDGAATSFDEKSWKGHSSNDSDLDSSEPPTSRLHYQQQRMKLQINTKRQEVVDVKASEERLRQAGRVLDENATTAMSTPRMETQANEPKVSPIPVTIWRDFISSEPGAKFPPEAGRYHLYASYACPGSHRALIVRALKGLEDVISVTIVHPTWRHTNLEDPSDKHRGWIFGDPNGRPFHNTMGRGGPFPPAYLDNTPDPVLNAYSVRNIYEYAKDTSGKYTIPLLWDTKLNTIVNNESSDISYMLNSCFNDFSLNPELDLYTEDDDEGLDRLNEVSQWLYPMMIHGVYRCGFAKTQRAYDLAIDELTKAFDAADQLLQRQRYLTGDTLTDADIRFFVTLIRFDEVYAFYFRANTRLVLMTPSLLNFCREIYQMPGIANTCHMDQIKAHFFGSHAEWNKYSVVPRGLDFMRYLEMPHDRDKLPGYNI